MLRKKMPKEPTKQPETLKETQIKPANQSKTALISGPPSAVKLESKSIILDK
jgi:hypothetical protein